jgi:hypothetical protein
MKRGHSLVTRRHARAPIDIKKDLSLKHLASIGAIALAYNALESQLDSLFQVAAGLSSLMGTEVSTRMPTDSKIELIKRGAEFLQVDKKDRDVLADMLGEDGFKKLKQFRDAVIHCNVINTSVAIGLIIERKAKISEVLLTEDALDALYDHLVQFKFELQCATSVLLFADELKKRTGDDPERESYVRGKPQNSARLQCHHNRIRALPPFPEFPGESEFRSAPGTTPIPPAESSD